MKGFQRHGPWDGGFALLLALLLCCTLTEARGLRHHDGTTQTPSPRLRITSNLQQDAEVRRTVKVKEGEDLLLTCTMAGFAGQKVSWFEHRTALEASDEVGQSSSTSQLALKPVTAEDDGRKLACRAFGSTKKKIVTIVVEPRPDLVGLVISSNQPKSFVSSRLLKVAEGSELVLYCSTPGYHNHSLSWWEGTTPLTGEQPPREGESSSSTNLHLTSIGSSDHGREFTCRTDGSTVQSSVAIQTYSDTKEMEYPKKDIENETSRALSHGTIMMLFKGVHVICSVIVILVVIIAIKLLAKHRAMVEEKAGKRRPSVRSSGNTQVKAPNRKQALENQILVNAGGFVRPALTPFSAVLITKIQGKTMEETQPILPKDTNENHSTSLGYISKV